MKQKILQWVMALSCFTFFTAHAQESEPNDTRAQANTLALNGSNTGAINVAGDEDWWSVTTDADGKLNITMNISNGLYLYVYLYDNNGTTLLGSDYANVSKTFSVDGLATGTYYLKCIAFYNGQLPAYTISNTLDLPAFSNDEEPNNTKELAKSLPLNDFKNGHIGYYYNNARDTFDWYKVTTNADGRLRLNLESGNGQYIYAYLYDNDGTTLISAGNTNSSATVVNADGLAAGTYYIRIIAFYNSGFIPYKLSDSLFEPAQSNDVEPNDTKETAGTLAFNNSITGHIGYYYNNTRDTFDWYKVTTSADGRLRLNLESGNGQYIYVYLYDNDGTTLISAGNTNSSAPVVNADGLAAGTYYIRINAYYNSDFIPYKLSDSLFEPAQSNDVEPNDTKETAVTLAINNSITGHIGYYYNNLRDTFDWYQITLPDDGNINFDISSNNGKNIYVYLMDYDGTTTLGSAYTNSNTNFNVDGLQSGTYYIRINAYYNNEYGPYTLMNTFTPYNNATDTNNNNYPYQAVTMKANLSTTGHVGFYYNHQRDTLDWHKIYYSGTGDLKLKISQESHISNNVTNYLWVYVYADTTSSPIASQYSNANSWEMNLTNLSQQYYYIKVNTYYSNEFVSYSIQDLFTQVQHVRIQQFKDSITNKCNSGAILYKCSQVPGPYHVRIFRYGEKYLDGNMRYIGDSSMLLFTKLPPGIYYARGYGDGATGNAFGSSRVDTLIPVPDNMHTSNIGEDYATLNWKALECLKYYKIRYRVTGSETWIEETTPDNMGSYNISGLLSNTTYEWQVASVDTYNAFVITSAYSATTEFTTNAGAFQGFNNNGNFKMQSQDESIKDGIKIYPNPANNMFKIQLDKSITGNVDLTLKTMNGKIVWSAINTEASGISNVTVDVSKLPDGVYMFQAVTKDGKTYNSKVVISR